MKKLVVAEVFYSLQCEGRAIGTPAVFLRLAGCNLLCKSQTWVCDTIEVWQKGVPLDFEDVLPMEYVHRLKEGSHLVITGGEPLLQQDAIFIYLTEFQRRYNFMPFIEVETNGTIRPIPHIFNHVRWWNVSLKLANSGEPFSKRYNEPAFDMFNKVSQTIFKFVVSNEEDVLEILQDFPSIDMKKVVLMPAGATREELCKVRLDVALTAIKFGLRYSERLHIVIWDKKTGV